jgi:hypothetical protein
VCEAGGKAGSVIRHKGQQEYQDEEEQTVPLCSSVEPRE